MTRFHKHNDSISHFLARTMLRRQSGAIWVAALLAVLILASCSNGSSEPEDRQFANDPTEEFTSSSETPTVTPPSIATEPDAGPVASPSSVLKSRGAPDTIYAIIENALTSVTVLDGRSSIVTWMPTENESFVAIDDSPDGTHVAALVDRGNETASLVVFDASGGVTLSVDGLIDLAALAATPVSDGTGGLMAPNYNLLISWSPLGDRIAAGASDGQLKSVAIANGEVLTFEADTSLQGLESAKWSPDGRSIGALVRNSSGIGQLLRLTLDGTALNATVTVGSENLPAKNSVEQFNWNVDGSSVFYVVVDRTDGEANGGQLFELNLADNKPVLVATSGRGGPSGGIASFVPSPDGRSIAITIAVRDGRSWTFHSLIVKSLKDNSTYDVPAEGLNNVPGVWWTSGGLLWDEVARNETNFILVQPDGSSRTLVPASPEGTPAAQATPLG